MRRRILIGVAAATVILVGLAAGAYAWDAANAERIAEGVRVGTVDVGGLSTDEAREVLREQLVKPLDRPIEVRLGKRDFERPAKELGIRADVDGMVAEAKAESREGALPARVWRYATGGEVDARVEPRVAYSRAAVDRFIAEIATAVNRAPRDASVTPSGASLSPVPDRDGIALREEQLRERIAAALQAPARRQVIGANVDRVEAEVTTDELAQAYPYYLTVDRGSFQLRFFRNLKLAKTYTIAVGQVGYDTPAGLYHIQNKAVNPAWSVPNSDWAGDLAGRVIPGGAPNNPLKARWMGIYNGAGIHGTSDVGSLGSAASHGCIRMSIPEVIELYDQVPVGTPVYIQ